LRQNPDIEMAELKGELLLLNGASNKFFVMNSTAAFVWGKLATPTEEAELISAICTHFQGISTDQARQDVQETLKTMREFGLILDQ
jgi:hypothetical protein